MEHARSEHVHHDQARVRGEGEGSSVPKSPVFRRTCPFKRAFGLNRPFFALLLIISPPSVFFGNLFCLMNSAHCCGIQLLSRVQRSFMEVLNITGLDNSLQQM